MTESAAFTVRRQTRNLGQLVLKKPKLKLGFRKALLKARLGEGGELRGM